MLPSDIKLARDLCREAMGMATLLARALATHDDRALGRATHAIETLTSCAASTLEHMERSPSPSHATEGPPPGNVPLAGPAILSEARVRQIAREEMAAFPTALTRSADDGPFFDQLRRRLLGWRNLPSEGR